MGVEVLAGEDSTKAMVSAPGQGQCEEGPGKE